ncbi:FGGY-family carbohydrate kinase [Mycolicibacterium sp.]|uniref:FGGY-family carbohydrate kinase n=1 Tax=Mycolicibacterium sp. TaxID=2320850 RepID=UPI001A20AE0A|nr:FGGY-family carbohydrate kinase [Mycolicibacterium sp.]MBJ7338533.1 FGGY-family carbohydrate kinase [Mycolicibacterium sp.]
MSPHTIGIDVGTTGTKTVLFDTERGIVAQAARDTALHSPHPGFAEADTAQWHRNVVESIREILATNDIPARDICAVAVSGMVPAVVPVDERGRPLRHAILQNDARAHREVAELAVDLSGVDLVTMTGSALTQQSVAPTTVWLRTHEPAVYDRTAHYVGSYDWLLTALGADVHVEQNWALESGLFTIDGDVATAVITAAGLDTRTLAPVRTPGTQVGELSRAAAESTGLSAGTALIVGGADHVLSAFAAGVNAPGDALVKLGGAGDILVASDTRVVDERLYLDAHPVPGHWLPNGCMATSGSLIRWFQALIGGVELTGLDDEAATCAPAEVLCLPYFLGEKSPLHDPDLRGAFAGMHLGHTRADLYRSVLEAIAFGFRHHVDVFTDIGIPPRRVMITNGGSRSTLWKQIHADVLGIEMRPVRGHPGASLGAAVIAAIGVGALGDWSDAARFVTLDPPVVPDPSRRARYDDAYQNWRDLGSAVAPTSHAMTRSTREGSDK